MKNSKQTENTPVVLGRVFYYFYQTETIRYIIIISIYTDKKYSKYTEIVIRKSVTTKQLKMLLKNVFFLNQL